MMNIELLMFLLCLLLGGVIERLTFFGNDS